MWIWFQTPSTQSFHSFLLKVLSSLCSYREGRKSFCGNPTELFEIESKLIRVHLRVNLLQRFCFIQPNNMHSTLPTKITSSSQHLHISHMDSAGLGNIVPAHCLEDLEIAAQLCVSLDVLPVQNLSPKELKLGLQEHRLSF